jgi:hypothetical protein
MTEQQLPPDGARAIQLTRGWICWVDEEDYPLLARLHWFAATNGRCTYASRVRRGQDGRLGQERMHKTIIGASQSQEVDHVKRTDDIRVVDNRKVNLRMCSNSENQANRRKEIGTKSIFKGVSLFSKSSRVCAGLWRARISDNRKETFLGAFTCEGHAAYAYDLAAVRIYGKFARTNFPIPGSLSWEFQ